MRKCGPPPDNQMRLDLDCISGRELMEDARLWAARHPDEWRYYKSMAREQSPKASPNLVLQLMRARFKVEVANAFAAAFARIAMEEDSRIDFRLARSKCDGYARVRL